MSSFDSKKAEDRKKSTSVKDASVSWAHRPMSIGPVAEVMSLQDALGNRAVRQVLQAKLTINQPGDKYEQEADRVAEMVMRMPDLDNENISPNVERIQRKCAACESGSTTCPKCAEEEEKIQLKPLASQITPVMQRQVVAGGLCKGNKDAFLQAKETPGNTPELTPQIAANITALRGGGQPLQKATRRFFEPRFGVDFSTVRVHSNAPASETARRIGARAYTIGQNIIFGAGQYAPHSIAGKRLLAHELTHVVQQAQFSSLKSVVLTQFYDQSADDDLRSLLKNSSMNPEIIHLVLNDLYWKNVSSADVLAVCRSSAYDLSDSNDVAAALLVFVVLNEYNANHPMLKYLYNGALKIDAVSQDRFGSNKTVAQFSSDGVGKGRILFPYEKLNMKTFSDKGLIIHEIEHAKHHLIEGTFLSDIVAVRELKAYKSEAEYLLNQLRTGLSDSEIEDNIIIRYPWSIFLLVYIVRTSPYYMGAPFSTTRYIMADPFFLTTKDINILKNLFQRIPVASRGEPIRMTIFQTGLDNYLKWDLNKLLLETWKYYLLITEPANPFPSQSDLRAISNLKL